MMSEVKAVIFDLDGTMLDNNAVHLKAWKKYLKDNGMEISDEDFKKNISGRTNKDATEHLYKKKMSQEEAESYYLKKEAVYREMYKNDIAPVNGLPQFLQDLEGHGIKMAIATSGIEVNINFMFEHVPVRKYFQEIISSKDIEKGKPDPEIFLKTAAALHMPPENCIVFEDSMPGVEAARAAGMKVVALTTSHSKEELNEADLVIDDYTQISFEKLVAVAR